MWPDEAAAGALEGIAIGIARQSGGRAVPESKIHLTLAFLGEVGDERVEELRSAAAAMQSPAFELIFDTVGWFRGARVGWAGSSRVAPDLLTLQSRLAGELSERGFTLDTRPYTPHVTLARKVGVPVTRASIPPIRWVARELALVWSERGTGRYTTIGTWSLGR